MINRPSFLDGYTPPTGLELTVRPVPEYPFAASPTPDIIAKLYRRQYLIDPGTFTPQIAERTEHENKVTYSIDVTNAAWTKTRVTAAIDVANPWDGQTTAATLLEDTSTDTHLITSASFNVTTATWTMSAIVKAGLNRNWCQLSCTYGSCYFDITNGTVGAASTATGAIASLGNGWWRISITVSASIGACTMSLLIATADGTNSYAGSTMRGLRVAHLQAYRAEQTGPLIITSDSANRTISAPEIDADDFFAYLVEENRLETFNRERQRLERVFARIPGPQIIPGTKPFDRPSLHDLKSGSTYAVSFDEGKTSTLFSSRKSASIGAITASTKTVTGTVAVSGTAGGAATKVAALPSGTVQTSEGNFFLSTSAASIRSTLSGGAITDVMVTRSDNGTISVSWSSGILEYVDAGSAAVELTSTPNSFTIKPLQALDNTATRSLTDTHNVTETYADPLVRTISSTGHGGAAGNHLVAWNGDTVVGTTKVISVATDSLVIAADDGPFAVGNLTISHIEFKVNGTTIANGPIRCSSRRTQYFYLAGVTLGVDTTDEIVPPTSVTDPQNYLAQVIAYLAAASNSTYIVHEVSDLQPWRGPIVMQEVISLQMADLVRTITP